MEEKTCQQNTSKKHCKHKHGPTSFWMHDPKVVFDELNLKSGDYFLDLGCGLGDYSIEAAKIIGAQGLVIALDKFKNLTDDLAKRALDQQIHNVKTLECDITSKLPVNDNSINLCLISTVIHSIDLDTHEKEICNELYRVLKPTGTLAIIECKKEKMDFGPPLERRIASEELQKRVCKFGFDIKRYIDLGHNYLLLFKKK